MNYSVQYTWPDGSTGTDPSFATNAPVKILEYVGKVLQVAIDESQTIKLPPEFQGAVNPRTTLGFPVGSAWRNDQIAEELHNVIKAGEVLIAKVRELLPGGSVPDSLVPDAVAKILATEYNNFGDAMGRACYRIAKLYAVLRRYDQWSDFEIVMLALMHLIRLEGAQIDHDSLSATWTRLQAAEEEPERAVCS